MKNPRAWFLFKAEGGLHASRAAVISSPQARGTSPPCPRSYGRRATSGLSRIRTAPLLLHGLREANGRRPAERYLRAWQALIVRPLHTDARWVASSPCMAQRQLRMGRRKGLTLRRTWPNTGTPYKSGEMWGAEKAFQPQRVEFNVATVITFWGVGYFARSGQVPAS